jgi:hypothetical protein
VAQSGHRQDVANNVIWKVNPQLFGVTALYDQFSGDSGRLHRSLRDHFVFMSASAGYPRFFKASSTPSISRLWIFRRSSKATCRSASWAASGR